MKDVDKGTTSNFNVSLAEIERVWIEKFDIIKTGSGIILFYGIAVVAAAVGFAMLLAALFHTK